MLYDAHAGGAGEITQQAGFAEAAGQLVESLGDREAGRAGGEEHGQDGQDCITGGEGLEYAAIPREV